MKIEGKDTFGTLSLKMRIDTRKEASANLPASISAS